MPVEMLKQIWRLVYQFRSLPDGLLFLQKKEKTHAEKRLARSFTLYTLYQTVIFILCFSTALVSSFTVHLPLPYASAMGPLMAIALYWVLNRIGKKTLGKAWFAKRSMDLEIHVARLIQNWQQRF